jgi:DNA-directed RNA polymerase subunit RPC12/RpoP
MAYKKILVDNLTCSRRFHIAFDDSDSKLPQIEIKCQHCGQVVFHKADHPQAKLLRDENLVSQAYLSTQRVSDCAFKDTFSQPSKPKT